LVYIVVLVLVVCLCPSSVRVVATFSGTVLFPLLCSVLPFFSPYYIDPFLGLNDIKTSRRIFHLYWCDHLYFHFHSKQSPNFRWRTKYQMQHVKFFNAVK